MNKKKKDSSVHVQQREKINFPLDIKEYPWTDKQKEFIQISKDKDSKIVFVKGPAGSSKTFLATYIALSLLNTGAAKELLYIRAAVESSDSKLGYLPGNADEKMSYYGVPLLEKLEEFLPNGQIDKLIHDKRVTVYPVGFTRGVNWNVKCIIIDEAQNLTSKELITLLTRIGKYSRCFVLADPTQSDINGKSGAFEAMCELFNDKESYEQGVRYFELQESDIMRSELCRFLVNKFKNFKMPPKH